MFSSLAVLLLIQATLTYGIWISVDNGGHWGDWGDKEWCTGNTKATGFSLKVETPLGVQGDDTALNAIRLYCAEPSKKDTVKMITSTEGKWGEWTSVLWCPTGHLMRFILQVEKPQHEGDDTAANNIMMQCSDHTIYTGNGGLWGDYGDWSPSCPHGICGIQTRVERPQGEGDDTSLNDVKYGCCPTDKQ